MTKGSDPRPHTGQLPVRFTKFFNSTYISILAAVELLFENLLC